MINVQDLETTRQELLDSLSFPSAPSGQWPSELKLLEPDFVQHLLACYRFDLKHQGLGQFGQLMEDTEALSDEGKAAVLASDITMLENLKASGNDQEHASSFQTIEGLFPIKIKGHIVGNVWTGKVFMAPSGDQTPDAAFQTLGLSTEAVENVSFFNAGQIEELFQLHRNIRDVLEQSLRQHLQIKQYTSQLLESERTHSLGSLSSGIAHHFNNLLSVILGYSSLVLKREDLQADAQKALRQISDAAQQGRRLTEEILAFTGSDVEEPEVCEIHSTMSSVLSLLQSQASSSIRIESQFNAQSDSVLAYPSEIRQIIFNLFSSAMDGMPTGGELSISTVNTSLKNDAGSSDCIRIEVIDSGGSGGVMEKEEVAFYDQDLSLDDSQLNQKRSSLYGMVGRMRGNVMVSSDAENHTRVEVLLPLANEPGTEEETKARKRLAPSHIWVVDDDPLFRQMCQQVLDESGHSVEQLTSGVELKKRWQDEERKPDLLVIDFSMPEYNGLELREWLVEENANIPVILISGFAENQPDIKKALQMRHTFFLQKPFSVPEMIDVVTIALGETLIGE